MERVTDAIFGQTVCVPARLPAVHREVPVAAFHYRHNPEVWRVCPGARPGYIGCPKIRVYHARRRPCEVQNKSTEVFPGYGDIIAVY